MEKRFVVFVLLSTLILLGYSRLSSFLNSPAPERQEAAADPVGEAADPALDRKAAEPEEQPPAPIERNADEPGGNQAEATADAASPTIAPQRGALGSMAAGSPYRLLVIWDNRGAAIERIELAARDEQGRLRYQDLDKSGGYLGPLGATDAGGGVRVTVVGPGTPAAAAACLDGGAGPGLRPGDLLTRLDDRPILDTADWEAALDETKPGQTVQLSVSRAASETPGAEPVTLGFSVQLEAHPLAIIEPELNDPKIPNEYSPLSCLLGLQVVGKDKAQRGQAEVSTLPSLRTQPWEVHAVAGDESAVEFRFRLSRKELEHAGARGELEVVKRYRLARVASDQLSSEEFPAYHVKIELEFHNRGSEPLKLAHTIDGANGLPTEGWWYSTKINPRSFSSVGARDVAWATGEGGVRLYGPSKIQSQAIDEPQTPQTVLLDDTQPPGLRFVGVDSKYFAAVLQRPPGEQALLDYPEATAFPLGGVADAEPRTVNVTTRLVSATYEVPAGASRTEDMILFAGPKQPQLLAQYGTEDLIVYGYSIFEFFAKLLSKVLHGFESLPGVNYGLAIILLTVLVRGLMFPISRKAAKNAQMMQHLAPEMKVIAEKYKNDLEKRGQAQRELFRKHNYNPFGGCLLMFLQLPVFVGLYKCLSVDIELRQATLLPGVKWCSNLAAPDMLFRFPDWVFNFIADESAGWLGPYFNILPCFTIALFIIQQKLFTPPATDEQTRMTQKMMNYMMIFMGVMFFKVPSGLCVYFIASSLWGIAERKLLPKPRAAIEPHGLSSPPSGEEKRSGWNPFTSSGTNGGSAKSRSKARRGKRRK